MKNSLKLFARAFMLIAALCITGSLYAQPPGHRHHPHKKNRYYYYPRQNVYYDPADNVYFVWERTYWRPVSYPAGRFGFAVHSGSPRFELVVASDHPYYYNVEHRRTYYEYRAVRPAPTQARVRVEGKPKPNVSFHLEINSAPKPRPVYVEKRVIVVKEKHHHGHGHHPGHGKGHGKSHGKGHRH